MMLSDNVPIFPDRVFGPSSLTESVYEEGVKNVALSALMGINGNVQATPKHFEFSYKLCIFIEK